MLLCPQCKKKPVRRLNAEAWTWLECPVCGLHGRRVSLEADTLALLHSSAAWDAAASKLAAGGSLFPSNRS